MYQPLIKFHPYPAIITQVLCIFVQQIDPRNEDFPSTHRATAQPAGTTRPTVRHRVAHQSRRRRRGIVARLGRDSARHGPRGDLHRAEQIPLLPRLDGGYRRNRHLQDRHRGPCRAGHRRGRRNLLPRLQRRAAARDPQRDDPGQHHGAARADRPPPLARRRIRPRPLVPRLLVDLLRGLLDHRGALRHRRHHAAHGRGALRGDDDRHGELRLLVPHAGAVPRRGGARRAGHLDPDDPQQRLQRLYRGPGPALRLRHQPQDGDHPGRHGGLHVAARERDATFPVPAGRQRGFRELRADDQEDEDVGHVPRPPQVHPRVAALARRRGRQPLRPQILQRRRTQERRGRQVLPLDGGDHRPLHPLGQGVRRGGTPRLLPWTTSASMSSSRRPGR